MSLWTLKDLKTGRKRRQIDWQSELGQLARRTAPVNGAVSGDVTTVNGIDRLVISRPRDTAPRQYHRSSRSKSALQMSGPDWDPIEEAFITFLDDKNAFAYVRSSIAAPPPSIVAAWLTNANIPNRSVAWKAEPLIDPAALQKVQSTGAALWVDIVARPPQQAVGDGQGLLASIADLRSVGSDLKVEVKISTTRAPSNSPTRQRIYNEAMDAYSTLAASNLIDRAHIKIAGEAQPIDLINHHLTYKQSASFRVGGRDRSLTEAIVFNTMDNLLSLHDAEIRRCLAAA